jgi:hypothetical protein
VSAQRAQRGDAEGHLEHALVRAALRRGRCIGGHPGTQARHHDLSDAPDGDRDLEEKLCAVFAPGG